MIKSTICAVCVAMRLTTPALAEPDESLSTPGGYQIVINPQIRADTFLLDTATGRMWTIVKYVDRQGEPAVWEQMGRMDNLHDYDELRKAYPLKSSSTSASSKATPTHR
jgi:hypothetical protein